MAGLTKPFTLRDVAILTFVVFLLLPATAHYLHNARSEANRTACASNLRQIGQSIMIYASATKNGPFPRTYFDMTPKPVPTEYTGVNATNPFQLPGGPGPNDVTAPLYLLLRVGGIESQVFICPTSTTATWFIPPPGTTYNSFSNFTSRAVLSYACTNPYPTAAARNLGYKLNYTLTGEFAIAADMGPGPAVAQVPANAGRKEMMGANTPNHRGDGQNVLYADGHVDWSGTVFCGAPRPVLNAPRDNIYAYGADTNVTTPSAGFRGAPQDQFDSVIMPTFDIGTQPGSIPAPNMALAGGLGATRVVVVICATVLILAVVVLFLVRAGRQGRVPPVPGQ
jgi:prepilin-type processing-associated H-X9-DG protein